MPCGLHRASTFSVGLQKSTLLGWKFAQEMGNISWSECPWTRLAQDATGNRQGGMEVHLSWGSPVCSAGLPGAVTHSPALSACVTEGESLPESCSCWSLLEGRLLCACSHPGKNCLGWRRDLAVPVQPCHYHTVEGLLMQVKPGPSLVACAWSVRMPT